MSTARRLLSFASRELHAGRGAVLVTVTDVTGASVRNPGAHLVVSASGECVGSLSGGCIERAVVARALEVLAEARPSRIAYGAGSPIIDIRLPCGGRVDLLFNPLDDAAVVDALLANLAARRAASLVLPLDEAPLRLEGDAATRWQGQAFHVREVPPLRLVIFGHGGTPEALVALARAVDVEALVVTPDRDMAGRLQAGGTPVQLLDRPSAATLPAGDPWTAYVCLFHDHDWEADLLAAALVRPSLLVGAMGSRRTHVARLEILRARGIAETDLQRIASPIGLFHSSRDPETLALSVLAQTVDHYNRATDAFRAN